MYPLDLNLDTSPGVVIQGMFFDRNEIRSLLVLLDFLVADNEPFSARPDLHASAKSCAEQIRIGLERLTGATTEEARGEIR